MCATVCVYVCDSAYTHARARLLACLFGFVFPCMSALVCACIYIYVSICVCECACVFVCVFVSLFASKLVFVCDCLHDFL